jgi:hypothetical protein
MKRLGEVWHGKAILRYAMALHSTADCSDGEV